MKDEIIVDIKKNNIKFLDKVIDWKEAIKKAAEPLLEENLIEERYVEAMIENVEKLGDYIILVPNVAMPHARPEFGSKETGVSFLKLDNPVTFGKNKEVRLIICLSTKNNDDHLSLLQNVSFLIDDEEKVDSLVNTKSRDEFYDLVIKFIEEGLEEE